MATMPNKLHQWADRRPVCQTCGKTVARPTRVREKLRGDCPEHGRTNAKWVAR